MSQLLPDLNSRKAFLDRCVLSASGLRFIHSGDEEDASSQVCDEAKLFVLCAIDALLEVGQLKKGETLWLGRDARPTGPVLLNLAYSFLEKRGFVVKTMGLGPIPEIMAATHQSGSEAFVYFTASHNPKGHNGLKLGLSDGAVLGKNLANPLIDACRGMYLDDHKSEKIWNQGMGQVSLDEMKADKNESLSAYSKFSLSTILPSDGDGFLDNISKAWGEGEKPLFLIDMNGSSRLASVDLEFLKKAGLEVEVMGGEPGVFHHAIIPEGASLEPLRLKMQEHLDAGRKVLGGMVPDCDGDRGNLILPIGGKAVALKAQETFALCVLAEFGTRRALGEKGEMALAANGPTSLRIDRLLEILSVGVHRAEVGEANVLAMAKELRSNDYMVPMAGEGSNGGNILHPSTVRDPLMTLLSLIKFIAYPIKDGQTAAEGQLKEGHMDPCSALEKIYRTLDPWCTTDAFEKEALMPVPPVSHEALKAGYESLIQQHFEDESTFWESKSIASIEFFSNDGTSNIPGPGGRPEGSKGGLQVFLKDSSGLNLGFLWMRGSGTEPVFRLMVDWSGSQEDYLDLLELHRSLLERAAVK